MEMGHDAIGVFLGHGGRIHPGKIEHVAEDLKILGTGLRLHRKTVDRVLGGLESPVEEQGEFMLGQVAPVLGWLVPHSNANAELTFRPVIVHVDAEEVIGRHGHLEVIAQPFWAPVATMLPTVSVSEIVSVQVMLLFPVVSFQDIWLWWVVQVGHGQFDGRLQSAQVDLHMTGRKLQFRLQGLTVLANGILDQIATEVTVDLEQILQAPSNLSVSQTEETKVSFIRVRKHTVQLFLNLRNKTDSITDAGLDGFFGGHVPALKVFQRFLPMLCILEPKIRELQEIDPAFFLFRIMALRAVGFEERLDGGGFRQIGCPLFGLAFVVRWI